MSSAPEDMSTSEGTATPDAGVTSEYRFVALAGSLVVIATWLRPASLSFWLDELGTWWVVKDGLGQAVDRALTYHGQSPAYYVVAWMTRQLVGANEFLLRVPSLLFAATAAFLLFRLARRLVDQRTAVYAVLGFVAFDRVAFAASEFRPYALGLVLVVAATLALVRWLDEGGWVLGVLYAASCAGVVWAHYLFALALIAHLPYAIVRSRRRAIRVRMRSLAGAWALALVLVAPLLSQLVDLWSRRGSLSIPGFATFEGYLGLIVPATLFVVAAAAVILARVTGIRPRLDVAPGSVGASTLVLVWAVLPPTVLILVSTWSPLHFFSPRYSLSAAPAVALVFGWAVASVSPPAARRFVAVLVCIAVVATTAGQLKNDEDWRGAAAAERSVAGPDTLVLLHPALVESSQIPWLTDPERRSYLLSPLAFYPFAGDIELLPYVIDEPALAYLDPLISERVDGRDRFLLVTRAPGVPYRLWLQTRLGPAWTSRVVYSVGTIQIVEFAQAGEM